MRNTPDEPDRGGPDGPGRPAAGRGPLSGIDAAAARLHGEFAELLRLTIDAIDWGGTGHTAGCTVRDYLVFEAGLPGWLAGQLESVARRIGAVPGVAGLFWAGVLGFDQLAAFVRTTSGSNGQLLARLDAECASRAEALAETGRLRAWTHEVEVLIEDLRAPGWRQRQERRAQQGQQLVAQQDFDGGGFIGEWLDAPGFATRMAAVDAATDPDQAARGGIRRARAEASVAIAAHFLAGTRGCSGDCRTDDDGDGGGGGGGGCVGRVPARPARPTLVVHVDLADATVDRFGHLLRLATGSTTGGGGGRLPVLSARMVELLAGQAQLVCQVSDGARPVLELVAADRDTVPARVRRMVTRRDRGCRFVDCAAPSRLLHVHHIVPVSQGGTHDPDNLIALCSFHHLRYVHRLGWRCDLDGATGRVTWTNTRTGTTMATMPHGHRPPPRRDPELLPDWLAPPRPPPPAHLEPPPHPDPPSSWLDPPPDLHHHP